MKSNKNQYNEVEHGIEKSIIGSQFGISRQRYMMTIGDHEGQISLSHPNSNNGILFFAHHFILYFHL